MAEPFIFDHGDFSVAVSYDDPTEFLNAYAFLPGAIDAAVNQIAQHVVLGGTVDITISVTATPQGRFAAAPTDLYATGAIFEGQRVMALSLIEEAATGIDRNPGRADITIYVPHNASYMEQHWFSEDGDSALPSGKIDLESVLVHELMHGMGVAGYRDNSTGAFRYAEATVFDTLVHIEDGEAHFAGAAVNDLLGEELELAIGRAQGIYHVGGGDHAHDSEQEWLLADNLNSYAFQRGEEYALGKLNLAILQDIGWQIHDETLADVTNLWDNQVNTRYLVGSEVGEVLDGGIRDDRIEGRGGNDLLAGLGGDDLIDGGDGRDIAVYSGNHADYSVTKTDDGYMIADQRDLADNDGTDLLKDIEVLRFADGDVSIGEPALTTASTQVFAEDGYIGEVSGAALVIGTSGNQDITVTDAPGRITFDPSFNRGGDVIRLHGEPSQWQAMQSGSSTLLSDGDTVVRIPVGIEGTTLSFGASELSLRYDLAAGGVMIGEQLLDGSMAALEMPSTQGANDAIVAAPFAPSIPAYLDPGVTALDWT
jgi:hypothetical protein